MHHDKCKDEFIKYWNEHYHNAVMPIQKKHELKKIAWEFWKEGYNVEKDNSILKKDNFNFL